MEIRAIEIAFISVGDRLRHMDQSKVDALAESIAAIGLQQPISVYSPNNDILDLVAGLHRLEACRKLGWDEIDSITVNLDDIDRQLWEIDENLMRAELGPAEMAQHIARRAELWEVRSKAPNNGPTCPTITGPGQPKGFAKDTEDKTGTPKRTTNRAKARGEAIPPDILALIRGTDLDTGTYLDKLKKVHGDEQRPQVERDLEAIEQRKNDVRLKEEEARRKAEAKEQRRRDFAEMGELLDKKMMPDEVEWFLNTLAKYAGKTAIDLRAWANL